MCGLFYVEYYERSERHPKRIAIGCRMGAGQRPVQALCFASAQHIKSAQKYRAHPTPPNQAPPAWGENQNSWQPILGGHARGGGFQVQF